MMDIVSTFSHLLREFRERRQLSCNELARAVQVDPSYISRLERGEREPPRRVVVEAIAYALQINREDEDRLLVSAGYTPAALAELGCWDTTIAGVAGILLDKRLHDDEIKAFREVVDRLVGVWLFRLNRKHGD